MLARGLCMDVIEEANEAYLHACFAAEFFAQGTVGLEICVERGSAFVAAFIQLAA